MAISKAMWWRPSAGSGSLSGCETSRRSVKSIVVVGKRGPEFDQHLGLAFEVLLQSDPARWKADVPMRFRLVSDDKPLAGALVKAIARDEPDTTLTARSGRNGEVSIRLPKKGVWLVEAVRMAPAPKDVDADWESVWASLTFEIP